MNEHPATNLAHLAYWLACAGILALPLCALSNLDHASRLSPLAVALCLVVAAMSPLAVILGGVLSQAMKRSGQALYGRSYAAAATQVGMLATAALIVFGSSVVRMATWSNPGRSISCASNLRQIATAALMYAQDYDDHLTRAADWNDALQPYIKNQWVYRCPEVTADLPSYGYNRALAGLKTESVSSPDRTVLFFDCLPGKDRSGGQELLPNPPRHQDGDNLAFLDGHVRNVKSDDIPSLAWRPTLAAPQSDGSATR